MEGIEYPGILKRYFATTIDALFIISVIISSGYLFQYEGDKASYIKAGVLLFMFFVYEPLCTSFFCTLGQKITGIRIRKVSDNQKISLPRAYIRIIVKLLLGIVSFFTVPYTKQKRAMHDFVVDSIVINKENASKKSV